MLSLPLAARYAVDGCVWLAGAEPDRFHRVADIAGRLGLPRDFLAKVFRRLLRREVLVGRRGPGGGYRLAGDPRATPVLDVIEASSGSHGGERACFLFPRACGGATCSAHGAVREAEEGLRAALGGLTLADLERDLSRARQTKNGGLVSMTKAIALSLLVAVGLAACKDSDKEVYRAPKAAAEAGASLTAVPEASVPPAAAPAAVPGMPPMGAMGAGGPELPPPPAGNIRWTAPKDWKSKPASGMRFATFGVPTQGGEAELAVVMLAGDAGGNLPNVNRWRGQLGLSPMSEQDLVKAGKAVKSVAGTLLMVNIVGADGKSGLVGAILPQSTQTWFFKLTGSSSATSAAQPAFQRFLESLR